MSYQEVLEFLKVVGEYVPGLETKYMYSRRIGRTRPKYHQLYYLQRKGVVIGRKINNHVHYSINQKKYKILHYAKKKIRKDNLNTLVVFDIPERKSKLRARFRRWLIKNEFKQLQKSVFITDCEIDSDLENVIRNLGLKLYIKRFEGKFVI